MRNAKNLIRNTRHNYDIDDLRKYMNQRMEQSFQWLSKKSEADSEDLHVTEARLEEQEDVENCSSTSGDSLLRRTFRFVRSFFQTADFEPGNCNMKSSSFWSLPTEQEAKYKLRKIESDFLDTTARINCKIIGEDVNVIPFSVHVPADKTNN